MTLKVYLLLCCLSESDVDFQFGNIYDNGGMKHLNKIQHKQEHVGRMSVLLLVAKMMASLGIVVRKLTVNMSLTGLAALMRLLHGDCDMYENAKNIYFHVSRR